VGNRLTKSAAVSARVFLAAGLGALGWTFFSATTAAASDGPADLTAVEASAQTLEKPAAQPAAPATAAVDAVAGQALSALSGTSAPASQPVPADLGVVQEIGTVVEDAAAVVEAPTAEVVQAVVPAAEAVVRELDVTVKHVDAAVQDTGLPAVLPEEPLTMVTDDVVGQVDEAIEVVTAPIEVVTAPVEQVLEPVTDELSSAVPVLPASPTVPVTVAEPEPAEPVRTVPAAEPVPAEPEPASQVDGTSPAAAALSAKEPPGSSVVEEAPERTIGQDSTLPSDGQDGRMAAAKTVDLQAQSPGQDQFAAADISLFPAPSPAGGPVPAPSFPVTNGGSTGGAGGGPAGHGWADAYLMGGQYQWLPAALANCSNSTALPASPAFDPGATPD
jgi:hypothetical protein